MRTLPATIDTVCQPLNEAWERHAASLIGECGICVEDTNKALNWDAFLGRSVPLSRSPGTVGRSPETPDFTPLTERGITLSELAQLWQIDALRDSLTHRGDRHEPVSASCSLLLASGGRAGELLCEAFRNVPKSSSQWSVRALLQNSSELSLCDFSFRRWLEREVSMLGEEEFPPRDFRKMVLTTEPNGVSQRTLEQAIQRVIGRVFHRANPVVAAHMLCDWQLGLWVDEKTEVFDLYPFDSHHQQFADECSDLPTGEAEFVTWWHEQPGCAELPPRLGSAVMSCSVQAACVLGSDS